MTLDVEDALKQAREAVERNREALDSTGYAAIGRSLPDVPVLASLVRDMAAEIKRLRKIEVGLREIAADVRPCGFDCHNARCDAARLLR